MKVLITGGAGNLARYCIEDLRFNGYEIVVAVHRAPDTTVKPWLQGEQLVIGDLTSPEDCFRMTEASGIDAVLHLGGLAYATDGEIGDDGPRPPLPRETTMRTNVVGTYYAIRAAVAAGASRFVAASSVSVLKGSLFEGGRAVGLPIDESRPVSPTDSYGLSKLLSEETLRAFSLQAGIRTVAFRLMWVYTPHEPQGTQQENPRLGLPSEDWARDAVLRWQYVDARDAATAFRLALESDGSGHHVFYLATDRTTKEPHRELIERWYPDCASLVEDWSDDQLITSIAGARDELGFEARHSWREFSSGRQVSR